MDNLACIFSMVFQAMHFTGKHDITDKADTSGWLLSLDDFTAAVPFLDMLGQIQHWPCEVS